MHISIAVNIRCAIPIDCLQISVLASYPLHSIYSPLHFFPSCLCPPGIESLSMKTGKSMIFRHYSWGQAIVKRGRPAARTSRCGRTPRTQADRLKTPACPSTKKREKTVGTCIQPTAGALMYRLVVAADVLECETGRCGGGKPWNCPSPRVFSGV